MWQEIQLVFSRSAERIELAAESLLPGLVAMLVILAVSVLLAGAVRWVLRRALVRAGFDRRAQAWGLTGDSGEWRPAHGPSELAARGAYWILILAGVALGLDVFGASTTSALGLSLLALLPRLAVGAAVFLGGIAASRFLERSALIGAVNMQIPSARLIALGVKWLVLVLATAIALQHVGLGGALIPIAFSIVLGGIVLALALAVGLGAREAVTRTLEKRMRREDEAKAPEADDKIRHL